MCKVVAKNCKFRVFKVNIKLKHLPKFFFVGCLHIGLKYQQVIPVNIIVQCVRKYSSQNLCCHSMSNLIMKEKNCLNVLNVMPNSKIKVRLKDMTSPIIKMNPRNLTFVRTVPKVLPA